MLVSGDFGSLFFGGKSCSMQNPYMQPHVSFRCLVMSATVGGMFFDSGRMFCDCGRMFCHGRENVLSLWENVLLRSGKCSVTVGECSAWSRKCSATVEECSATVEECSATVGECSALVHLRWGSEIKTVRTPVLAETAPENLSEFLDDVPKC